MQVPNNLVYFWLDIMNTCISKIMIQYLLPI